MKKTGITAIVLSLMMLLFGSGFASAAAAQRVQPEGISYVALGDSLASGQTPFGQRVGTGYADMLAGKIQAAGYLETWTKSYAKSGAKSAEVLLQAQAASAELKTADLVTVHAGANDLLGYMLTQLTISQQTGTPLVIDQAKVAGLIQQAATNIGATVQTIRTINPEAKVLVLGYYNALPYLPAELQQVTVPGVMALNQGIQQAAAATGATYVDVFTAFAASPTAYLPNPVDVHPNEAGYQTITNVLWGIVHPALPALKANHILNQANTVALTSNSRIANALELGLAAKQEVKLLPASAEKTYLSGKLDALLWKLDQARKALKRAA